MKYLKKFNESSNPQFPTDEKEIRRHVRFILSETNKRQGYFPDYHVNPDGTVDVDGSVFIEGATYEHLPIRFGHVDGNFNLESCRNLKSLHGSPKTIFGSMVISNCEISSFEGGPEIVKTHPHAAAVGAIAIWNCKKLTSLEGFPLVGDPNKLIGKVDLDLGRTLTSGNIILSGIPITSLVGLPKEIQGNLSISHISTISTLEGCPDSIGNYLKLYDISNLISTKGISKFISSNLVIDTCKKLVFPEDLRDIQVPTITIDNSGLSELISQFPNPKTFLDSLDYNYFKIGNPQNPKIDLFRFKQAWEELCGDSRPSYFAFRTYKLVDERGNNVDFDGNPI